MSTHSKAEPQPQPEETQKPVLLIASTRPTIPTPIPGESPTSHALYAGTKAQSKNRTAKIKLSRGDISPPPPTIKAGLIESLTVI